MGNGVSRRDFLVTATAATAALYTCDPISAPAETRDAKRLDTALSPSRSGALTDVARNRAVYQSSSVDDDHTGHLVTDGSDLTYWAVQTRRGAMDLCGFGWNCAGESAENSLGRVVCPNLPHRGVCRLPQPSALDTGVCDCGWQRQRRRLTNQVRERAAHPSGWSDRWPK